jgi:hypothetical protein
MLWTFRGGKVIRLRSSFAVWDTAASGFTNVTA